MKFIINAIVLVGNEQQGLGVYSETNMYSSRVTVSSPSQTCAQY